MNRIKALPTGILRLAIAICGVVLLTGFYFANDWPELIAFWIITFVCYWLIVRVILWVYDGFATNHTSSVSVFIQHEETTIEIEGENDNGQSQPSASSSDRNQPSSPVDDWLRSNPGKSVNDYFRKK